MVRRRRRKKKEEEERADVTFLLRSRFVLGLSWGQSISSIRDIAIYIYIERERERETDFVGQMARLPGCGGFLVC